jgi:hypothetical protein
VWWHEGGVAGGGHGVADEPGVGHGPDSAGHGRDGACPGRRFAEVDVTYHPGDAGSRIHRTVDADVKDHGTCPDVLGPDQPRGADRDCGKGAGDAFRVQLIDFQGYVGFECLRDLATVDDFRGHPVLRSGSRLVAGGRACAPCSIVTPEAGY